MRLHYHLQQGAWSIVTHPLEVSRQRARVGGVWLLLGALWLAVVVAQAVSLVHRVIHTHGIAPALPVLLAHGQQPSNAAAASAPGATPSSPGGAWHALADSHDEGEALCLLLDQLTFAEWIGAMPSSAGQPRGERSCDGRPIGAARDVGRAAYLARAPPTA